MFTKLILKPNSDSSGWDESNDDKFLTQPNIIKCMMFSGLFLSLNLTQIL